jgi:hypothetical protein
VAREDLDAVGKLEQSLQACVEVASALDRLDREIGAGCVTDEERVAGEHEPGLLSAVTVDDCETAVLWPVTWRVQYAERNVPEHDLLSVLQRVVLVRDLGGGMDPDRDPLLERQAPVARDVVGVRVGFDRAHNSYALPLRGGEVLLRGIGGIDDDRLAGLLVADEIRGTAEVLVDELPEDHGFDRNTGGGLFS